MSDDDWKEIKRRQDAQRKREADERRQRALDASASEEQAVKRAAERGDSEFDEEMRRMFGSDLDEIQRDTERVSDADVDRAMREIQKAKSKGNTGKAKRIAKKNKDKIKAAAKEGKKKGSGCAVVGLLLLGSATAIPVGVWYYLA